MGSVAGLGISASTEKKKRESLIHATTCVNIEDIMLSGISQTQRTNITCFHLFEVLRIVRYINRQKVKLLPVAGGGTVWSCCLIRVQGSSLGG